MNFNAKTQRRGAAKKTDWASFAPDLTAQVKAFPLGNSIQLFPSAPLRLCAFALSAVSSFKATGSPRFRGCGGEASPPGSFNGRVPVLVHFGPFPCLQPKNDLGIVLPRLGIAVPRRGIAVPRSGIAIPRRGKPALGSGDARVRSAGLGEKRGAASPGEKSPSRRRCKLIYSYLSLFIHRPGAPGDRNRA